MRWAPWRLRAPCSMAYATTTRAAGELADRVAEVTYLLSDVAADVASYAGAVETDPARLAAVSERRAALTALTRKYGETAAEVLAWAESVSSPAGRAGRHRRPHRARCVSTATPCAPGWGRQPAPCRTPASRRPDGSPPS